VKYKFSKIAIIAIYVYKTYVTKQLFTWLRYTSGVCKHKKTILSYRTGRKVSSKLLFISSPNI